MAAARARRPACKSPRHEVPGRWRIVDAQRGPTRLEVPGAPRYPTGGASRCRTYCGCGGWVMRQGELRDVCGPAEPPHVSGFTRSPGVSGLRSAVWASCQMSAGFAKPPDVCGPAEPPRVSGFTRLPGVSGQRSAVCNWASCPVFAVGANRWSPPAIPPTVGARWSVVSGCDVSGLAGTKRVAQMSAGKTSGQSSATPAARARCQRGRVTIILSGTLPGGACRRPMSAGRVCPNRGRRVLGRRQPPDVSGSCRGSASKGASPCHPTPSDVSGSRGGAVVCRPIVPRGGRRAPSARCLRAMPAGGVVPAPVMSEVSVGHV